MRGVDLWALKKASGGSPEDRVPKTFSDATTAKFHRGQRQTGSERGHRLGLGWISGELASQKGC